MTFSLSIKTSEQMQAEALAAWRAEATCTPLQGKLALGEAQWAAVEAILANPATAWATRQAVLSALTWKRSSPEIAALGAALGLSETQIDDLFRLAVTLTA